MWRLRGHPFFSFFPFSVGPAASFPFLFLLFLSCQNRVSVFFSDCSCPAAPAPTDTKNSLPHPSRTSITMCGWGAGAKGVQSIRGRGGGADRETGTFGGGRTHRKGVQTICTVDWTGFGRLAVAKITPSGASALLPAGTMIAGRGVVTRDLATPCDVPFSAGLYHIGNAVSPALRVTSQWWSLHSIEGVVHW